jgi:hypothetical protein
LTMLGAGALPESGAARLEDMLCKLDETEGMLLEVLVSLSLKRILAELNRVAVGVKLVVGCDTEADPAGSDDAMRRAAVVSNELDVTTFRNAQAGM